MPHVNQAGFVFGSNYVPVPVPGLHQRYQVLNHLVALLNEIGIANEHFPIDLVIDQAITLGNKLWATDEGNQASTTLYAICRHFGRHFSAEQIWRMITRGESIRAQALTLLAFSTTKHMTTLPVETGAALPDTRRPANRFLLSPQGVPTKCEFLSIASRAASMFSLLLSPFTRALKKT